MEGNGQGMDNNSVQYVEKGRGQQGRLQAVRDDGARNGGSRAKGAKPVAAGRIPGASARRMQNGGMPRPKSGRVMNEREQFLRQQQQQLQMQQKALKRRFGILIFFLCVALVLNTAVVAGMYFRMQRMEDALETMKSGMFTGGAEGTGGTSASSDAWTGSASHTVEGRDASYMGNTVTGQDYINLCGLDYVDRPQERTAEQVLKRLEQLAKDDGRITEILENRYQYPDKILEALANNPEMTDFVMGYGDNVGKVTGGLTEDERKQDFPLFLQWDPRWGYGEYGDGSCIALAGCGPTCLSMALFYLTGNESLTPDKMAEYSMKNGYYISGTGTAWALLQDVPEQYGVHVYQCKTEEYIMKDALDKGSVLICSMGPGDFTAAGHFIVIYGYDKTGFLVNDPNCVARSRQAWSFSELDGQIKNIWVLGGAGNYGGVTSQGVTAVTDHGGSGF
ncbi:MAG: C39 family peptidase [Blautia sp.]|nr:C39 family peptidase [Blautia sp.]